MKNLILISVASLFALAASAQTATDNQTVNVTGPTLRIDLPSQYHRMHPDEFYDYMRSYSLSNGGTLAVFYRGRQMYAEVGDLGRHEIVAAAPNVFVALDQQLRMTINLRGDTDASGELIMVVPRKQLADGSLVGGQRLVASFR
ncbi:hypothetical protein SAMN04515618_12426 [Collimonas sp. OK307]|uniref:hypothetical protein n=1 Tax=Collimonas sp. OK307 TaxID=1801620 RepID=UPI0008E33643|nr:hypothetical protein [Collimonas sp. OK307]SFI43978.1 hypothetical protein SAMN04515618_12426 [Collimonas sp. OK307]